MLKKGIIDRFEGDYVVIEINDTTQDYPKSLLPSNVEVGDMVIIDGSHIMVDKKETKKRKERIKKLMDELWED